MFHNYRWIWRSFCLWHRLNRARGYIGFNIWFAVSAVCLCTDLHGRYYAVIFDPLSCCLFRKTLVYNCPTVTRFFSCPVPLPLLSLFRSATIHSPVSSTICFSPLYFSRLFPSGAVHVEKRVAAPFCGSAPRTAVVPVGYRERVTEVPRSTPRALRGQNCSGTELITREWQFWFVNGEAF